MKKQRKLSEYLLSDFNHAQECESKCGVNMFECIEWCDGVTECISSCYRENTVCIDACPCHHGEYNTSWCFQAILISRLSNGLLSMQ